MKKPFFARFLESQELQNVVGGGKGDGGGGQYVTLKWPSDQDEGEIEKKVTLRYPSDDDWHEPM